jgi:hypothetical protein
VEEMKEKEQDEISAGRKDKQGRNRRVRMWRK